MTARRDGGNRIPVVRMLRDYERGFFRYDLVAGLVLATMLIPQGMAYAELTGLPAITGIYTTIAALLAYSILGRWNEAKEEGQKALRAAQELSDNSMISFAAFSISDIYLRTRDLDRAIEYGQLSVQTSQTPANEAWAKGYLAAAWILSGEPEKAIEVLEALVEICRASRFVMGEVGYLPILGEAYRLAREFGKAKQTLVCFLPRTTHAAVVLKPH